MLLSEVWGLLWAVEFWGLAGLMGLPEDPRSCCFRLHAP